MSAFVGAFTLTTAALELVSPFGAVTDELVYNSTLPVVMTATRPARGAAGP